MFPNLIRIHEFSGRLFTKMICDHSFPFVKIRVDNIRVTFIRTPLQIYYQPGGYLSLLYWPGASQALLLQYTDLNPSLSCFSCLRSLRDKTFEYAAFLAFSYANAMICYL